MQSKLVLFTKFQIQHSEDQWHKYEKITRHLHLKINAQKDIYKDLKVHNDWKKNYRL